MEFNQENVYSYSRIKAIEDDKNIPILFLFVSLSIERKQILVDTKRQRINDVVEKIYRFPLATAPAILKDIPNGDYFIDIPKNTFNYLENLATQDFISFASFQAK